MEIKKKVGVIAIAGRPSAGKSTLVNTLIGEKVSIVSPVPQTTRRQIRGIYQDEEAQIIFVDTPGFHLSTKQFNTALLQEIKRSLSDADLVLYIIDLTRRFGAEEEAIISLLQKYDSKVILIFNKTDLLDPTKMMSLSKKYIFAFPESKHFFVSAASGAGCEEVLQGMKEKLSVGPLLYPEDYYTDQNPELRITEIIREKIFLATRDEIPHSIFVDIHTLEQDEEMLTVLATIYTETESQKKILTGKDGALLRKINQQAQRDLEQIFGQSVFLDCRIKVHKNWRTNSHIIKKILSS